ncbi:MAG: PaaI family thioesterase [Jatrophihabitans sp.]|uniref:PaaI family thioesterase n=1 Tax=Jatrophihabitans sp. TaxID=1932789 RepID=UPI003F7DD82E
MSQPQQIESVPFAAHVGVRIVSAEPARVVGELPCGEQQRNFAGVMHGGAIMTLADTVGGFAAWLNLPEGATGTTTTHSETVFLRAVRSGVLHATATPLHVGRSTITIRTELHDDEGRLVAQVTQGQAVLTPR